METIVWGAVASALVGVATYAFKKYFDFKLEKSLAGQIEVLRKQYVDRFDTLVRLTGMLAQIDHCLEHLRNGDRHYAEQNREWCRKVRSEARSSIALVGQTLVDAIKLATDAALEYTDNPSAETFALWKGRLAETYGLSRLDLLAQR